VLKSAQGTGLGRRLMDDAMAWLTAPPARAIWLGVWSGNDKAQGFYRRYGFEKAGEYRFRVGETLDHEFIFRRPA
jgi:ribosomal protein S18 acetylase RimI-like enzyme